MLNKNEYFSNCYKSLISNIFFHLIIILLESFLTIIIQIVIFIKLFGESIFFEKNISKVNFLFTIDRIANKIPICVRIVIISIIFALIIVYYYIFSKFSLKKNNIWSLLIINIFEIFIFRLFFLVIYLILFSIENKLILFIFIIISVLIIILITHSFYYNHLYYFSPHFIIYPYDYYSSFNDIFHIFQKFLICISFQSSNNNLTKFIFTVVIILQIICLIYSIYIFKFKSFYIMSNIFLNKARFSCNLSMILINLLMLLLGRNNLAGVTFIIFIINIYIISFFIINEFYNPYNYAYFGTDENIENIFFYFYMIDHIKNKNFIFEEKLEEHISSCRNCDLCQNISKCLKTKFDYKKIFKVLFKNNCSYSKIMNEIIHALLAKGKKSLKNNSYYLINIIYCYYIYLNKKEYVLSSNMKIIYEIINEENINIQENHLLSAEQIFLINEFLNKSNKILNEIQEIIIVNSYKEKIKILFELFHHIFELKDKKFKTKLYYNKNEGIINFFRHISICTMIYEELFNVTLSNGGLTLKENPVFLDDISNKHYLELNKIIIQLNLLTFENKIIYITGEFSKYKDRALCQLFPNIFRSKQLQIIRDKLTNPKSFNRIKNDTKQKDFGQVNNNKDIKQQYIDFHFVIYDNIENGKKFKMINLKVNLIYPLKVTKKILLSGSYSIEKNIIITLDKSTEEKKEEYVLNYDDEEEQNEIKNNILVKYKRKAKYYNNQKLIFVDKYFINPNIYNIYYIYKEEKQKSIKDDIIQSGKKNLYDNNESKIKNNIYGESDGTNYNFLIQSTASTSTFNQFSNDRQGFKKRNKGGKKDDDKKKHFKYYQIGIVIFSIIILLCQVVCHIAIIRYNNNLENKNLALSIFKNYYGLFNVLFNSILSLSCLTFESKGEDCSSLFKLFEDFYINNTGNNFINITEFMVNQNKYRALSINGIKKQIMDILSTSDDENLNNLVNSKVTVYYITQNITQNDVKLNLQIQNNSFLDVLNYMTTSFLVMTSNYEYTNENVYIVNQINPKDLSFSPFNHIKVKSQLSQYQSFFYYIVLNYKAFIKSLDIITIQLIIKTNILGINNIRLVFCFMLVNLLFYLLVHCILFLYIQQYFKLIADLFQDIQNKLNLKNDNISVSEMFYQKIEKLKIIISLYKQDIYQAIVDLNFIYDNYKKFIEEKNRETAKYLKKEKYINESSTVINSREDKLKKMKIKYIIGVPENMRRIIYLSISLFCSIIIILSLSYLWSSYYSVFNRIYSLIQSHGSLSNSLYKLLNYYHLMIYENITIEDINNFERYNTSIGEDIFSNIYKNIRDIYDSKKYMDKLGGYNLDNIDAYYNYTCKTYYESLFKTDEFLRMSNTKYKEFLTIVCENSKIFKTNNYKQIFSILFEYIQIGINEINDHSYKGLIKIMLGIHYPKTIVFSLTVYNYALEILGLQLQRKSYQKISAIMVNYVNISFIIFYISSFFIVLIILFGYIWNLNNNYNKIHELKKIFKICNSE